MSEDFQGHVSTTHGAFVVLFRESCTDEPMPSTKRVIDGCKAMAWGSVLT